MPVRKYDLTFDELCEISQRFWQNLNSLKEQLGKAKIEHIKSMGEESRARDRMMKDPVEPGLVQTHVDALSLYANNIVHLEELEYRLAIMMNPLMIGKPKFAYLNCAKDMTKI